MYDKQCQSQEVVDSPQDQHTWWQLNNHNTHNNGGANW